MEKLQVKKKLKNPNRFFRFWLEKLSVDAHQKSSKVASVYEKALRSLKKYPLNLSCAKECQMLNGFGPAICEILDLKLKRFAKLKEVATDTALALGNSMPQAELSSLFSQDSLPLDLVLESSTPTFCVPVVPHFQVSNARPPQQTLPQNPFKCKPLPDGALRLPGGTYSISLLVDSRETYGMSKLKELLTSLFVEGSMNFEIRNLAVGDFAWVARTLTVPEGDANFHEIVLGVVIERKRADDLAASIVDGRFLEQKSRMQKLRFKCIYLLEECHGMKNFRISFETLLQSLINAQLIDGFDAVTVSNNENCAAYLSAMSRVLQSKAKSDLTIYCGDVKSEPPQLNQTLWGIPWAQFVNTGKKSQQLPLREEFARHLLQVHTMTGPKVADIIAAFPTPISLFSAYDYASSLDLKKELLLRHRDPHPIRSISRGLSEFLYYLYNTQ